MKKLTTPQRNALVYFANAGAPYPRKQVRDRLVEMGLLKYVPEPHFDYLLKEYVPHAVLVITPEGKAALVKMWTL